ncbi:MAG: hypothetical protein ACOCV9_03165 [Marinilabiliaceae bacterium]
MKIKLSLCGLCFLLAFYGKAQNYDFPSLSTSAIGLSGASDTTCWSVFSNPSGISFLKTSVAGGGYYRAFMTDALSARSAFVVLPSKWMHAGGGYVQYGNSLFSVRSFSLTLARRLSPRLQMGCRLKYVLRSISWAEDQGMPVWDAGFRYGISDGLWMAVMARNPAKSSIKSEFNEQPIPSFLAVACDTRLSPSFFLTADVAHHASFSQQTYGLGLSAMISGYDTLRGSVSARPVVFSVGATLNPGPFMISVATGHHDRLGMSPSAGITYHF